MDRHNILSLLGLSLRGGRLAVGEEPVEAAARARDARVLLLASDAAEGTRRRVRALRPGRATACGSDPLLQGGAGPGPGPDRRGRGGGDGRGPGRRAAPPAGGAGPGAVPGGRGADGR